MSYAEAIRFLYGLRLFGAKFGLENVRRLAALADHPQDRLRFIHVAGTNGKGSTCAMLESIYRAAGLRVGLFTSPHLVSFRERMQVDRQLIGETEVVSLVEGLQPLLRQFPADHHPTFFEVVTVMALRFFARQQCDLVIWETGLGGRLDATNIVTPLASLITNVAFDHQQWLGDSLEKIAREKAGIIKPGVPALTAAADPGALRVIEQIARERQAPLRVVSQPAPALPGPAMNLPLAGPHQRANAALAAAAVEALQPQIPVTPAQRAAGLQAVRWPGRMQLVDRPTGGVALLDGAHNPAGAEALQQAFRMAYPGVRPAMIFGVFRDKDSAAMCRWLAPLASRIALVPIQSERTERPENLVPACRKANARAPVEICASLAEALDRTRAEPFVLVAGSLYLIGEALELLDAAPAPAEDEKELNEWKP